MKISKKILTAITVAAMAFTLTACSGDTTPQTPIDIINSGSSSSSAISSGSSENTGTSSATSSEPEQSKPKYPEIPDEKPVTDFTYVYNMEKDGIEITGYSGSDMKVWIPDTIEGEKVTFINCEFPNSITQIEFPDSVSEITQLPKSIKYFNIPAGYKAESSFTTPQLEMVKTHGEVFVSEKDTETTSVNFSNAYIAMPQSSTLYILGNGDEKKSVLNSHYGDLDSSTIKTVKILDGVEYITGLAFHDFKNLSSVTIPESVTEIKSNDNLNGYGAFSRCENLTNITLPSKITKIADYAFCECPRLTSITIPDSVTKIGKCAFYGCTGLTSITIPNSVTEIGEYAFYNCTGLTTINVDSNNQNYTSKDGVLYNKDMTTLIKCPEKKQGAFSIPDSVTKIGGYAFYNCTGLTSVTIPNSVTKIDDFAFYKCTGLTSVTIPNSVTKIGDGAFYGCTGLASVTIPDSVSSIWYRAFGGCTGLTSISIPDSVTKINDEAFSGCTAEITYKGKTYTSDNYKELYKAINGF